MGELQTQPINNDISTFENDSLNDSTKEDESIWGKLFPLKKSQETIGRDHFTFFLMLYSVFSFCLIKTLKKR
jgi:hypothetical protein